MADKALTIYRASAGSGKTFMLTRHFLTLALASDHNYARILAITFTRKATAEMRQRIVDELHTLATGGESAHRAHLAQALAATPADLQARARRLLHRILHDYSNFSVTTIDQFFQRIIRSLARELGIPSGFSVELDEARLQAQAVEALLDRATDDPQLAATLRAFVDDQIDDERNHAIDKGILSLLADTASEEAKQMLLSPANDDGFLERMEQLADQLRQTERDASQACASRREAFAQTLASHGLTPDDLPKTRSPLATFYNKTLKDAAQGKFAPLGKTPDDWDSAEQAFNKTFAKQHGRDTGLISQCLSQFRADAAFYAATYPKALTSNELRRRLWTPRLFWFVWRQMSEIKTTQSIFVLGDAPVLLSQLTERSDTPFIFERIANHYRHFMIDEFQDTSRLQWGNLRFFLEDNMAQFAPGAVPGEVNNLIVGDVKQAIYRFRNGDWTMLESGVGEQLEPLGVAETTLDTNYRSQPTIVAFNNLLFDKLPGGIPLDTVFPSIDPGYSSRLRSIFRGQAQRLPSGTTGDRGEVTVEWVPGENRAAYSQATIDKTCAHIAALLKKGARQGDIAVLTRNNHNGRAIATQLLELATDHPDFANVQVSTNDVLTLENSPAAQAIVHLLRYLTTPTEQYHLWMGAAMAERARGGDLAGFFKTPASELLPELDARRDELAAMPAETCIATLACILRLDNLRAESPYLARLQSFALAAAENGTGDRESFLELWDEKGGKTKLAAPSGVDAIQVMTIHNSKGLQFKHVIVPFADWEIFKSGEVKWVGGLTDDPGLYLPAAIRKDSEHTLYKEQAHSEYFNAVVDSMNMLYVALTRAEESLYVLLPSDSESSRVSSWITGLFDSEDNLRGDTADDEAGGRLFRRQGPDAAAPAPPRPAPDNHFMGQLRLRPAMSVEIRTTDRHYSADATADFDMAAYGSALHKIMEEVSTADTLDAALAKARRAGALPEADIDTLADKLRRAMSLPGVAECFAPGVHVHNEQALVSPDGKVRRPDRLVQTPDGSWRLLDYKFGRKKSDAHTRQVAQYVETLAQSSREVSFACVLYVLEGTLTVVK